MGSEKHNKNTEHKNLKGNQPPPRVAPHLKGAVKNRGIKAKKK